MSGWAHRRRRRRGPARDVDLRGAVWMLVRRQVPPAELRLIRMRQRWPTIAGAALASRAYPAEIHGGTLTIHVANEQWRHELEYMRPALLARVGEFDRGLHTLRIRRGPMGPVGPLDPDPPPPPPSGPSPWSGFAVEPPRETFDALMEVRDVELREALASTRMLLSRRASDDDAGEDPKGEAQR